jgi:3-oxoacyl-[acyl-carrier-protein] synthase-3
MTRGAAVTGWGAYLPARVVTNDDLAASGLDTSDEWIRERTGIRERRFAAEGETTATLAIEAGAAAIKDAGLAPGDIDLVILATTTPDQLVPAASSFVADGLGLTCGSFDLNAACAGFAYSLVVATSLIGTGAADTILLIGSEVLSRFTDPEDRGTAILFGDGAGAAVLRATTVTGPDAPGLLAWDLGCDGSGARLIEIPAGGSRLPPTADTIAQREHFIHMQGSEVFRRAVRTVVDSVETTLERAGVTASDLDLFVPHQANARIVDAVCARLGIPMERTVVNIDRYGNTSAASIPLALAEAAQAGRLQPGQLVLLSGFGAGMTWASALLRWGDA